MKQKRNRPFQWILFLLPFVLAFSAGGGSVLASAVINHTAPEGNYIPGFRIQLDVNIQNAGGLLAARCYFKAKADQNFAFVDLFDKGGGNYQAILPAPWVNSEAVEYLFVAVDKDKKVTRSEVYTLEEGQTKEAAQWKDASQVKEVRLDTMQESIEDCELLHRQLRTSHGKKLPKYQTADDADPLTVQTEMSRDLVPMNGFYDKAVITEVPDSAKYGAAAIGAAGGHSTAFWVGASVLGAAAVGGTAAALSGGGGGGGGHHEEPVVPPEELTEETIVAPWDVTGSTPTGSTTSGNITFNDDGSFSYTLNWAHSDGTTGSGSGTGTWTLVGTYLTMTFDGGAVYKGYTSGDSQAFTMESDNTWTLNFTR